MTTRTTPVSHEPAPATPTPAVDAERADLLAALGTARTALLATVRGLDDDRLGDRPTAGELCLGGLIKHVASMEEGWLRFVVEGPSAMRFDLPEGVTWAEVAAGTAREFPQWAIDHRNDFQVRPGETSAGILARYEQVAARTEEIVRAVPDLSATHPVPDAPWNESAGVLSVRGTLLHVIAETAQHAGHADIVREALDGQKST
ncbi:DinB family protein [Streptomyces sp. CA-243310]|uniref:DinB family protein n=1 Tax=Streptomyces sp. CA-243310 TaxID=3240056 RepID=UPI003D8B6C38